MACCQVDKWSEMNSTENFNLCWGDFQKNISSSFQDLRMSTEFSDVTLACEGGQVEAHRIILASGSKFFSDLLSKNIHPHPLVYMKGLKSRDLAAVMDFIYHGQVDIREEDLNGFLTISEDLEIKGLTGSIEIDDSQQQMKTNPVKQEKNKTQKIVMQQNIKQNDDASQFSNNFKEKVFKYDDPTAVIAYDTNNPVIGFNTVISMKDGNQDIDYQINSMLQKADGVWSCTECGRTNISKYKIRRHIETHIQDASHPCNHCGNVFSSRNSLQFHVSKFCKLSS